MKRLFAAVLVLVLSIATALPAVALTSCCGSVDQNGELCSRHCDFYDENDNYVGSISEDYNC